MQRPLLFIIVWLATAELVRTAEPCPTGRTHPMLVRGQSCYEFDGTRRVTWMMAQRSCQQRFGRLVFIPNAETQSWLEIAAGNLWPNQNLVWIGSYQSTIGGNVTWDDYNGTAQRGTFYNWQSPSSLLSSGCMAMRKYPRWQWAVISCSTYCTFVCEYPAVMITSATVVAISTEPLITANRSTSADTTAPIDLELFAAVSADTTMEKVYEQDLVLALSTSIPVVLFAIASVLILVFLYRRKRHSKNVKAAKCRDARTIKVVNNPSYATCLDRDSPTSESGRNRCMEGPPHSGYTYIGEMPNTEIAAYAESFDDVGHTYAEPLEPWLPTGDSSGCSTAPNGSGLSDGHADIAHTVCAPTVIYTNGVPMNVDSSAAVLTDDVYVEVDPLVSPCNTSNGRPPCSNDVYRVISDCQANEYLQDSYAIE